MNDIATAAHAVLLPIGASLELEPWLLVFLGRGGRTVLAGETREEYVARAMSAERRERETPADFRGYAAEVARVAGAPVAIAVDAELGGIQRLSHLAPELPARAELATVGSDDLEARSFAMAAAARSLGVTLFLGPILDVIIGRNVWLQGRTMASDPAEVQRLATAYVAGCQRAGIVATAKHFPGYGDLSGDPALEDVSLRLSLADVERGIWPFRALVAAGVGAVMVGPAAVEAIDPGVPAALSARVVARLRDGLGFRGLIVSDDLDAPSTCQGESVGETAVRALAAGVDLLLVSGGPGLEATADAIVTAVESGRILRDRLLEAAGRVRSLADGSGPAGRSAVSVRALAAPCAVEEVVPSVVTLGSEGRP